MHTLVGHSQANAEANALEERLTGVDGGGRRLLAELDGGVRIKSETARRG